MEASKQSEIYEERVRAFFESLRQPFEEATSAARKNYDRLLWRLLWLGISVWILALPFAWAKIPDVLFHRHSFTFFGITVQVTDLARQTLASCIAFAGFLVVIVRPTVRGLSLSKLHKILASRYMPFALSYAIGGELDEYERHKMAHHQKTAVEQWIRLLRYLRSTFDSLDLTEESFYKLPAPAEYAIAPRAKKFAEALNWKNVQKPAYAIVTALNSMHEKISPRLLKSHDVATLRDVFCHLANFFYSSLRENRDDYSISCWGYEELTRAVTALNSLPTLSESLEESKPRLLKRLFLASGATFYHRNLAVAFIAWWIVIQALCTTASVVAFRFYPELTIDSTALITLIVTPVLAAGAMVGVSRRSS